MITLCYLNSKYKIHKGQVCPSCIQFIPRRAYFIFSKQARERELESLLSERPDSNNNETLDLLTEMRQKDNTIKKIKDSHNKTLETLKKEVERQVNALQSRYYSAAD